MKNPNENKKRAVDFLKAIETGDTRPLAYVGKYVQHNVAIPDGIAGLAAVLEQLPKGSARVNTVRAIQDEEFVVTHTDYNFFGPKVGFDIFRFEDGKMAEHWDNLQAKPTALNPSGRSMIDGPTEVTDSQRTDANKALARAFVDDVLLNGRMEKIGLYCEGDRYLQHNPMIGDGLTALGGAIQALAKSGTPIRYHRIHRVLGEGSFVLVVSEGTFGDQPTSYYDLFRAEGGKLAEHWDVMEAIAPKDQWKNANGKF